MITILLQGGLGNQMFQYALGEVFRSQGKQVNFVSKVNMLGADGPHDPGSPSYGLSGYDTEVHFATKPFNPVYLQSGCGYDPHVLQLDNVFVQGYWQSEKYFHHLGFDLPLGHPLSHRFFPVEKPKAEWKELAGRLLEDDTVVLQVRRGDYLNKLDFHGVLDQGYYLRGIEVTGKKQVFIITDDEKWCRENLPGEIVNTGSRYWDIALMSGANSIVIANSTFGWWGAWLGDMNFRKPGRKVIAPVKWFATDVEGAKDIVPDRWERI